VNISVRLESDALPEEGDTAPQANTKDNAASDSILPVRFNKETENVSNFRVLLLHNLAWVAYEGKMYYSKQFIHASEASLPPKVVVKEPEPTKEAIESHASKRRLADHSYARRIIGAGSLRKTRNVSPVKKQRQPTSFPSLTEPMAWLKQDQ
jgi:hypothetical protein